jgi:hypothetical protein
MSGPYGAAAEFVAKEFGGRFTVSQRVVTVDATDVEVAPNDPDRVQLVLLNLGSTSITVSFKPAAVLNQGILLLDNASLYSVNVRDDAILPALMHRAIGSAVGGSLLVLEIIKVSAP